MDSSIFPRAHRQFFAAFASPLPATPIENFPMPSVRHCLRRPPQIIDAVIPTLPAALTAKYRCRHSDIACGAHRKLSMPSFRHCLRRSP